MDIQGFRQSLPIYAFRQQILSNVKQNQISIVSGETGCGKTTQVPQYLYEELGLKIAVTQPRRLAAITIAKRVAEEKGTQVGGLVGYHVRFDDCSSAQTKIKFMTDGMLIRELIVSPELPHYDCVIIDEAHERTVQSDLLL